MLHPDALQQKLNILLHPLGLVYGLGMHLRAKAYSHGLVKVYEPSIPCVAIGNIAWGGTGKTPLTEWLLLWAKSQGLKACVLSRGYKGKAPHYPLLIGPDTPACQAGDEPVLLHKAHPEAHIVVDPKRARGAAYAESTLHPDILLLDDGMQHLAMGRHLNLVLLRPQDVGQAWNRVIPAGQWRESRAALSRADAFFVKATAAEFDTLQEKLDAKVHAYGKPVFSFSLEPYALRALNNTAEQTPNSLAGKDYVLVTAVGNPQDVYASLTKAVGTPPSQHRVYPDHHAFSPQEQQELATLARQGLPLVCTAKDAVKLENLSAGVWVTQTRLRFGPALWSACGFPAWWQTWWQGQQKRPSQSL